MVANKPKVLWVGDLVVETGFGRVSHAIIEHLTDKYHIVGLGVNYRGDPHKYDFPIFPASTGGRIYGEDRLAALLNSDKFDILFILNDAWVVSNYLEYIKRNVTMPLPKIVVYFPVDSENHNPDWYRNFDMVCRPATYTEYGRTVINDIGCKPDLKLDIIPHGVNQSSFYRKYTNRRDAKEALANNGKSPDSFVFLNANRNQPRKKLDITLNAFKLFAEGKDDVLLYMHCGVVDSSINIAQVSQRLGIDSKLILTNLHNGVQAVPVSALNEIYNSADVGLNSGMGEGWGLCLGSNTDVMVEGKGLVKISNVVASDRVLTHEGRFMPVTRSGKTGHKHTVTVKLKNEFSINCTADHNILSDSGWKKASNLTDLDYVKMGSSKLKSITDFIVKGDGLYIKVDTVLQNLVEEDVYNLEVDEDHSFCANGLIVHNCNIEHAMTGAPQIVPNHSACAEIYSDCGLLVPTTTKFMFDNSMTVGKLITPEAMAEKMQLIYSDKKLYKTLSEKSIKKFSDPKYSWKTIAESWDQLFQEVLS